MEKISKLVLAFLLLCGILTSHAKAGELYLELGVGADIQTPDEIPQGIFRFRYELDKNEWWKPDALEFDHHSSIFNGRPFNDDGWPYADREKLTDQFSIIWRFKLK